MDHEGPYEVRVDVDGPLGPAAIDSRVDATYDLRPPPYMLAWYLVPFLLAGVPVDATAPSSPETACPEQSRRATQTLIESLSVTASRAPGRSPTTALLLGLIITLATVVAYSWYISGQISGLRRLQTELTDRNRRDSLQLLRIQNDLNQLGLAMRDMLDGDEPYPLTAWSTQFDRIRTDLDEALNRQGEVALAQQTPEQRQYLASQLAQFWDAADRIFELARTGREDEARAQIRLSLQERQASLSTAVARLLVQNNAAEEQTAQQVQDIYGRVQRQVYWFLAATLGSDRRDQLVLDPFESPALRAARRRSRTSGASWRRC